MPKKNIIKIIRMKIQKSERLDHIDALRGVAILLVILVHTSLSVNNLSPTVKFLSQYGQMGVQLFFLVSGFTLSYAMDKGTNHFHGLKNYFFRRYFRIAPLYYFGIFFYFILAVASFSTYKGELAIPDKYTTNIFLSNLSFTHGFYPPGSNSLIPGGWSIGTEMAFYLIFPFIFSASLWVFRLKKTYLLFLPVLAFALTWVIQMYYAETSGIPLKNNSFMYFNLANQLPVFVIGIATYFLVKNNFLTPESILKNLALFLLFAAASMFALKGTSPYSYVLLPTTSAISFVFLLHLFSKLDFLSPFWLRRIGQLSYSMYIFHIAFAWVLTQRFLNPLITKEMSPDIVLLAYFFIVIFCTYFVSLLSERYIEIPGIRLGKKFQTRRTQ